MEEEKSSELKEPHGDAAVQDEEELKELLRNATLQDEKPKAKRKKVKKSPVAETATPPLEKGDDNPSELPPAVEPVIHVVIRTHDRPRYFKKCIESIAAQKYERTVVHVIADTPGSAAYVSRAVDEGLVDDLLVVNRNMKNDDSLFGNFGLLMKSGLCTKQSDYKKHWYDVYLNKKIAELEDGWVFIVDDDKEVPAGVLKKVAPLLDDAGKLIIGQYKMKARTLPAGDLWEKRPFTRAHIDMSCIFFHAKHKELAKLDGHGAGDWRMCNELASHLEPVWLKTVFVVADNNGLSGKGEQQL